MSPKPRQRSGITVVKAVLFSIESMINSEVEASDKMEGVVISKLVETDVEAPIRNELVINCVRGDAIRCFH